MKFEHFSDWATIRNDLLTHLSTVHNLKVWSELRGLMNNIQIEVNRLEYLGENAVRERGILVERINSLIEKYRKQSFLLKLKE